MENSKTKLVLLGTGTPNACPDASGPSSAIVVGDKAYLIDFGPGVVRQASKAYRMGIDALNVKNLCTAFCTHLHSDHTAGYPDLILTPWVLERDEPLKVFGPKGLKNMTDHILEAYKIDINLRINGLERANRTGIKVEAQEIKPGTIYEDDRIKAEAFPVSHEGFESYGYRFTTDDRVIVISGDTCPVPIMAQMAKDCDILLHEVYYAKGLEERDAKWQKYHRSVHTSSLALAEIAKKANPKLLVTYHRIYHTEIHNNKIDIEKHIKEREDAIYNEICSVYKGRVAMGHDLDVY